VQDVVAADQHNLIDVESAGLLEDAFDALDYARYCYL
jgi:hypothetical protein